MYLKFILIVVFVGLVLSNRTTIADLTPIELAEILEAAANIQHSLDALNNTINQSEQDLVLKLNLLTQEYLEFGNQVFDQAQPIMFQIRDAFPTLVATLNRVGNFTKVAEEKITIGYVSRVSLAFFGLGALILVIAQIGVYEWKRRRNLSLPVLNQPADVTSRLCLSNNDNF